jgi:hypothetical protein
VLCTHCRCCCCFTICFSCSFHALTLTLLKAAWRRTQQLVAVRADAIRAVAAELLAAEDEKIEGTRLVEIIEVGVCCVSYRLGLCWLWPRY